VCKTIDCLIATFCIRADHSLLHRDRDFDPFEVYLQIYTAASLPYPYGDEAARSAFEAI
jgi:hypothetical protein